MMRLLFVHRGLTIGFLLHRHSVVFTVESLSLIYLFLCILIYLHQEMVN